MKVLIVQPKPDQRDFIQPSVMEASAAFIKEKLEKAGHTAITTGELYQRFEGGFKQWVEWIFGGQRASERFGMIIVDIPLLGSVSQQIVERALALRIPVFYAPTEAIDAHLAALCEPDATDFPAEGQAAVALMQKQRDQAQVTGVQLKAYPVLGVALPPAPCSCKGCQRLEGAVPTQHANLGWGHEQDRERSRSWVWSSGSRIVRLIPMDTLKGFATLSREDFGID